MLIVFSPRAWNEHLYYQEREPKLLRKVNRFIEECRRHPFTGSGQPEPLKNELSGFWSRRITKEHRLVYRVVGEGEAQRLEIAQCRFHY